ncbi:MAG: uncharacterized protein QOD51_2772 [Candidatus Eremiobacteraeota bacterium]|nr:uncharacterized protein [Candidatus Eremiobacteraeota bacterium]
MPLLRNTTTGEIVATRIDRLSTFLHRAVGLLARTTIRPDEGVWITSSRAIHTLGMRVAIDVIFVDRDGHVIRVVHNVKPNRVALSCKGAQGVVELGGGALREVDVLPGDVLELV